MMKAKRRSVQSAVDLVKIQEGADVLRIRGSLLRSGENVVKWNAAALKRVVGLRLVKVEDVTVLDRQEPPNETGSLGLVNVNGDQNPLETNNI